jgi:hypothetical protein
VSAPEENPLPRQLPLPRVILVDTSIFDQQAYNFASAALTQLTSIAMSKQLTLLLPDPIEREK